MLKDSKKNKYSYSESSALKIFGKLLERGLIKPPESKRLEEIKKTNDPKYCKYHRVISHPKEKCKAFKGQVMQPAKEGKITLDEEIHRKI